MDAIVLKEAGLILLGAGLLILVAYCIAFMKNLVATVKQANKILENAQVVSQIAADRSKDIDKIMSDMVSSAGSISEIIKGNKNKLSALTSLINAIASLKNLAKNK